MKYLRDTKSVCPECLKTVDAQLMNKEQDIYLVKSCADHGDFQSIVWRGEPNFMDWEARFAKKQSIPKGLKILDLASMENSNLIQEKVCPQKCGLCAEHEQSTCTVLYEVTQACNLSCPICFANSGRLLATTDDKNSVFTPLSKVIEQLEWIRAHAGNIILQLSGGEPSLHPQLSEIIKVASKLFPAVQLNTNGILLGKDPNLAKTWKESGLSWVFLQFDSLDDEVNLQMRGAKLREIKQKAIDNCKNAHLSVVLVCTLARQVNDDCLELLLDFSLEHFPTVKALHLQPMTLSGRNTMQNQEHLTLPEVIQLLEQQSKGQVKKEHAKASDCEHALCSFNARYFVDKEKKLQFIRQESSTVQSQDATIKTDLLAQAPKRSVETVIRSWQGKDCASSITNTLTETESHQNQHNTDNSKNAFAVFDEFIKKAQSQVFSISCMAFQDVYTLDLQRLKQCCIHIYSQQNNRHCLIPFCAYNLSAKNGQKLYRSS